MNRHIELAQAYSRARLVRVADAVLWSVVEAENVVSDVWLRLVPAAASEPGAAVRPPRLLALVGAAGLAAAGLHAAWATGSSWPAPRA